MKANKKPRPAPASIEAFANRMMTATFSPAATEDEARSFLRRFANYPTIDAIFVDQPWVGLAREILAPLGIHVGVEAAYPVGNWSTRVKVAAIREGVRLGADEIDIGGAFTAIKSGDFAAVLEDAKAMMDAANDEIRVMVLPEVAMVTHDELARTLEAYAKAGVTGIKTSSGYGWNTDVEDVRTIRRQFGETFQIDVSGGVRTVACAMEHFAAGADNIHVSPIFRIIDEAKELFS
jgi:deoxyribose-phosphate aldolase